MTTPQPAAADTAAILRAAAAGRREYAGPERDDGHGNVRLDEMRDALMAEADTLELAARVAEGDYRPLYGWLPSWRWTAEMDRLVLASAGDSIGAADVAALAPGALSERDEPPASDRVETAARVLHARRHRAGYSHVCDACRGDARAVAAALTATEEAT